MANEFQHKTVGTELSQAEFEDILLHQFESQATGDILIASSATQLSRLASAASGQVLTAQGVGVAPAWAAASAGALTYAGGNTTEATTSSTSTVDLLTVTGLSIAVGTPIMVIFLSRKTGTTSSAQLGFKLNATQVKANAAWYSTTAGSGIHTAWIGARQTSYGNSGYWTSITVWQQADQGFSNIPVATITDVIVTALVANASDAILADELHVYTLATS